MNTILSSLVLLIVILSASEGSQTRLPDRQGFFGPPIQTGGPQNDNGVAIITLRTEIPSPIVTLEDPNLKFPLMREEPGTPGEREIAWTLWERPGEFTGIGYLGSMIETPPQPTKIYKGTKLVIGEVKEGLASWYRYGGGLTTASTKYPKGTYLRVTNLSNSRSVILKVNDYGPSEETGRIVDLERKAFQKLAPLSIGVIRVKVEEIL